MSPEPAEKDPNEKQSNTDKREHKSNFFEEDASGEYSEDNNAL